MWAEFFRTHLAIRASALTFAILLSLVPILALTTSILKGLGNDEQLKQAAIRFIDQVEGPILPAHPILETGAEKGQPTDTIVATHLHRAIDIIFQYVDRTNFAALGVFGVLSLVIVTFLVLASIEEAMNVIWHTRKGRPLRRKVMDYLALLILLPLSLNIALAAEAILANQKIMEHLTAILPSPWILAFCIKLAPFISIVLTLMLMYLFFPHVKVKTSAACTGAIFAATFWFIFQKLYIQLQVGVANYNAIYGSFASVPLFLIWLHIGWTFILLGASLAYAIQHHQHYHFSWTAPDPQNQLRIALDVLRIVYDQFERRLPATLDTLCAQLPHTRYADVKTAVGRLIKGDLLHSSQHRGEEILVPVTTADRLTAGEVVRLIFGNDFHPSPGGNLASQAVEAAASALNASFFTQDSAPSEYETPLAPDHSSHPRQQ
jgi:membrane protein